MKHTKGPWIIDRFEDKPHQRRHTILGNGFMICDTWSMFEDEETEANAHLIAAAPDLLEACKGLLFDLQEHWIPKELHEEDYPITAIHIARANQAIAKAERRDER